MVNVIINPYKNASASATAIRDKLRELGAPSTKKEFSWDSFCHMWTSNFPVFRHDKMLIVNWGNSDFNPGTGVERIILDRSEHGNFHNSRTRSGGRPVSDIRLLNSGIRCISDKLQFFRTFGVHGNASLLPAYWQPLNNNNNLQALRTYIARGGPVVERQKLSASSGDGIRIIRNLEDLDNHRIYHLYTAYIKKAEEYRVHFGEGRVIAIQQKRLRRNYNEPGTIEGATRFEVRNLSSGWVFCRENVNMPPVCLEVVNSFIPTLNARGIDFGAIDLIYNQRNNQAYILEVNSAPGTEGQTVSDYAGMFKRIADAL